MHFGSVLRRGLLGRRLSRANVGFVGCRPNTKAAVRALPGHQRCEYSSGSDGIRRSPYGTIQLPDIPFHECVFADFGRWGDKLAVECSMSGKKYTFAQLMKASKAVAAALQNKFKLSKGDTVAIFLPNVPEYPVIFLAGSQAGVVVTTVNSSYRHEEVGKQIEGSGAKCIFTMVALHPIVDLALKSIKKNIPVVVVKDNPSNSLPPGAVDFAELTDPSGSGELRSVDIAKEDTVVLPYSSGTTGLPKGVELMHGNLVANLLQVNIAKDKLITEERPGNIVLGLLPMFHIYGMTVVTFATLRQGYTLISMPKFDPVHFVQSIYKNKISMLYLVPPLILFLSNHPLVTAKHLKHVEYVINGASPCGHNDMERLLKKGTNMIVGQGYGMTETSPVVLMSTRERAHKYGGTGVPIPSTEVKIVDVDTLEAQPSGKTGEIWVRGPQVMKGYLNNPKATKEMIDEDGWLRTGDLGYYDEDGDFFISDRMKDLIKVKGFQVPPAELEELLRSHPKILDAAVIGIPHATKGEVPKAFVVVKQGEKITEEEVKEFVKGKVAPYKALDGGVTFLESIPKSASGKILKKELK